MKRILVYGIFLFLPLSCFGQKASSFFGDFTRNQSKTYLYDGRTEWNLKPANFLVANDLSRLSDGDQISLTAKLDTSLFPRTLIVERIDSVSLKKLIGLWGTIDSSLNSYHFESFTRLKVNDRSFFKNDESARQLFRYRLQPGSNSSWLLHMNSKKKSYFARLKIRHHSIDLRFESLDTGKVIHRVRLQRLSIPFSHK